MGEFPNKETQFSKENQPEGRGRKKGSKCLKTILKELLAAKDPDGEWGGPVAQKLLKLALEQEDMRAIEQIIDRIEGKVAQKNIDLEGQHTDKDFCRKFFGVEPAKETQDTDGEEEQEPQEEE